jgi:hypothetical protein
LSHSLTLGDGVNKIIIAVVLVVIIAAVAVFMLQMQPAQTSEEATPEESAILEDLYTEMLNEELDSIEAENFSDELEDEMASDLSQFFYE